MPSKEQVSNIGKNLAETESLKQDLREMQLDVSQKAGVAEVTN